MAGNCMICGDHIEAGPAHVSCVSMMQRENARLREALTPSAETKAEYIGEFHFAVDDTDEEGHERPRKVTVPWDTTKDIMRAILARAGVEKAYAIRNVSRRCRCGHEFSTPDVVRPCPSCDDLTGSEHNKKASPLDHVLCMDQAYSLPSVIEHLCAAVDHLLVDHACDQHGHETWRAAREAAKLCLDRIRAMKSQEVQP